MKPTETGTLEYQLGKQDGLIVDGVPQIPEGSEPYGVEFYNLNPSFRLTWCDAHYPDPRFQRFDLDLTNPVFPQVTDPFMFKRPFVFDTQNTMDKQPAPIEYITEAEQIQQTVPLPEATFSMIRPSPIYDESMERLTPSGIIQKYTILEPTTPLYGVGLYSLPQGVFVQSKKWGVDHNLPSGAPLILDNLEQIQTGKQPRIKNIAVAGHRLPTEDTDDIDTTNFRAENLLDYFDITRNHEIEYFHRIHRDTTKYPIAGVDYKWNDDLDPIRAEFEIRHQKFSVGLSRSELSNNWLDNDVAGLNDGGNDGLNWLDPMYYNNANISAYPCLFHTTNMCYYPGVCEQTAYAEDIAGESIEDTNPGFRRNTYAGVNGNPYCMYKRRNPGVNWQHKSFGSDCWFKYYDVPRRAVEYDGHYRLLLNEILTPFRTGGDSNVIGGLNYTRIEVKEGIFALVASDNLSSAYDLGQLKYELGDNESIPKDTVLFWYDAAHPSYYDLSPGASGYNAQMTAHKASSVYARIWQINERQEKELWVVKLDDDYVKPEYKYHMCSVADSSGLYGGANPSYKDLGTKGMFNGGMRRYMERYYNEILGMYTYRWAEDPYELNPQGFYVTDGAEDVWVAGGIYAAKTYVDIPDIRASGLVSIAGLPGEEIRLNAVTFRTPFTTIKQEHSTEVALTLEHPLSGLYMPQKQGRFSPFLCAPSKDKSRSQFHSRILTPDDITTIDDVHESRNRVLPISAFMLTSKIPAESTDHIDFDATKQDWTKREQESISVAAKRSGFRTPAAFCYMRHTLSGQDVEDKYYLFSKTTLKAHRNKRVYMPNSRVWWHQQGLLGCGFEIGTQPNTSRTWPSYGNGFTQKGTAIFSLWPKYVPHGKRIKKAYLSLVPKTDHYIDSRRAFLPGTTMSRTLPGNCPFEGQTFVDPTRGDDVYTMNMAIPPAVSYREIDATGGATRNYLVEWSKYVCTKYGHTARHQVEGRFIKAYEESRKLCGDYEFGYTGTLKQGTMANPESSFEFDRLFFKEYLYDETKAGHLLDDIDVMVNGEKVGETKQRSLDWYKTLAPYFQQGRHTVDNWANLGSRYDLDEDDDKGYGFACKDSIWAQKHRIFDITKFASEAYRKKRFDAKFQFKGYGQEWFGIVQGAPEGPTTWPLLNGTEETKAVHGETNPNTGIEITYGAVPATYRIICSDPMGTSALCGDSEQTWGTPGEYCYAVLDLKVEGGYAVQKGLHTEDAIKKYTDTYSMPYSINMLEVNKVPAIKRVVVTEDTLPVYVYYTHVTEHAESEVLTTSDISGINDWTLLFSNYDKHRANPLIWEAEDNEAIKTRYLRIVMPLGGSTQVYVYGVAVINDVVAITSPPNGRVYGLNDLTVLKEYGTDRFHGVPLYSTPASIVSVRMDPISDSATDAEYMYRTGPILLQYQGIYGPSNLPTMTWGKFEWNASGTFSPLSGTYCYDVERNWVITPVFRPCFGHNYLSGANPFAHLSGDDYQWVSDNHFSYDNWGDSTLGVVALYGAGASVNLIAQAEVDGPCYDVGAESVCRFWENNFVMSSGVIAGSPSGYVPSGASMFGTITWSTINHTPSYNGYRMGNVPNSCDSTQGIRGMFWDAQAKKPVESVWSEKAEVLQTIYGAANTILPANIDFVAPANIKNRNFRTGLIESLSYAAGGISESLLPNGGIEPAQIEISLCASKTEDLLPNELETERLRKKQVAYQPVVYVYLEDC